MKWPKPTVSLYLILIFAVVLRFIGIDQSFWLDEAAQAVLSENLPMLSQFTADFQPPLFYYLTYAWIQLADFIGMRSEAFLRVLPVAFGIATVYLLYRFLSEEFDKRVGLLGSLLLATSPFHVYYSQEFRMYSMLTFVALLSWYLLMKKKWVWFAVTASIGIFTHYFMFVNLAAQFVYIFATKRKDVKTFLTHIGLALVPFVAWIPTFLSQVETSRVLIDAWPGWAAISNPSFIRFPFLTAAKFTVGMISPEPAYFYISAVVLFTGLLLVLLLAAAVMHSSKKINRKALDAFGAMFILPIVIAWIGGLWISAASPWRIQFVLPALYGIIAITVLWLHNNGKGKLVWIIGLYFVAQNLFFTSQYLFNPDNYRENWREAVQYSDQQAADGALVLSEFQSPFAPMQWYSDEFDQYMGVSTQFRVTQSAVEKRLGTLALPDSLIVYSYLFELSDPDRVLHSYLIERGYSLESSRDFHGVGIVHEYGK